MIHTITMTITMTMPITRSRSSDYLYSMGMDIVIESLVDFGTYNAI